MSCLGTSAGGCVQSALQPFARQKIVDRRQAELERGQAPGCRVRRLQLGHLRPQCVDLLCFAWVHSPQPASKTGTYREHAGAEWSRKKAALSLARFEVTHPQAARGCPSPIGPVIV
jgi:hypothetical protein